MVERLAERLQQEPDNLEGWVMLGRSYFILKRYSEAAQAYANVMALAEEETPDLLADYAEALAMAYQAVDQGAAGVDMGRNIFQAEDPIAMIQAVRAVVHEREKPEKAFELYQTLKTE